MVDRLGLVLRWGLGLGLLAVIPSGVRAGESYRVDERHAAVLFSISHFGFSYTYGQFNRVHGSFYIDRDNPALNQFKFSAETETLDTNDPERDTHLRGPDFFNTKQFPEIRFESKSVIPRSDGFDVIGTLTILGVAREVELPLKLVGEGTGPNNFYRMGYHCEFRIKRTDYGMNQMLEYVGDDVALTISFEGVRQ